MTKRKRTAARRRYRTGRGPVADDRTPETRIGERVTVRPNGCWIYGDNAENYGTQVVHATTVRVHRFVYETLVGPIPDGHHLHHECQTPACCNPAHLLPLSPKEHKQRHAEMERAS